MIEPADIEAIDKQYFEIIRMNSYYVTLRSRNTRHEWHLLERIANGHRTFVISHRHKASEPFHLQRNRTTIKDCCAYIKSHDAFQMQKDTSKEERRRRYLMSKKQS